MRTEMKYSSKKRTHERIKEAFAELLAEKKEINNITVAELAARAQITRGTFYAHFNNLSEVAEEIEDELISTLGLSYDEVSSETDFVNYLHRIFKFLADHEDLYRQLLSSDDSIMFISRLNQRIEEKAQKLLHSSLSDRPMLNLDIAFFTDGATYMILKYFRNDISLSLDEIEWYLRQRLTEMFFKDEEKPKAQNSEQA